MKRSVLTLVVLISWLAGTLGVSASQAPVPEFAGGYRIGDVKRVLIRVDAHSAWIQPGERVGTFRLVSIEDDMRSVVLEKDDHQITVYLNSARDEPIEILPSVSHEVALDRLSAENQESLADFRQMMINAGNPPEVADAYVINVAKEMLAMDSYYEQFSGQRLKQEDLEKMAEDYANRGHMLLWTLDNEGYQKDMELVQWPVDPFVNPDDGSIKLKPASEERAMALFADRIDAFNEKVAPPDEGSSEEVPKELNHDNTEE